MLRCPADGREGESMSDFWMSILAAQKAAAGTKPPDRRHRVLSIVGGIALAVLIGAGLFIAAALNG
jgi:divalent metal cation (Fe/Co/Zn/Cd) transporter